MAVVFALGWAFTEGPQLYHCLPPYWVGDYQRLSG